MMATGQQARPWVPARALALAGEPGLHRHPTEAGFFMRVSPQGKAVWGWRFRDGQGVEQSGTLGTVAAVSGGDSYSLEDAVEAFRALRALHADSAVPGKLTIGRTFDAWSVTYKPKSLDDGSRAEPVTVTGTTLAAALERLRHRHLQTAISGGLTVEQAFQEWIREHKKKGGGVLAQETVDYYKEAYERGLKATVGGMRLETISTHEWKTVLSAIRERSKTWARGTYWMAHAIYRYYIDIDLLDKNPLAKQTLRDQFAGEDTKKPRKSHIKALDIKAFAEGIQKVRRKPSRTALMTLLLTGLRKTAVLQMRWEQLDRKAGTYEVLPGQPGWKGYVGPIALSDYALGYLDELNADPRYGGREYVFEARHGDKPFMTDIRGGVTKAAAGLSYKVMPHDLRRTFITVGSMVTGGDLRTVGFLAGHKKGVTGKDVNAVTANYAMRNLDAERVAANRIAETILELAGELPMSDETLALLKKHGFDASALMLADVEDDDDEDAEMEAIEEATA